MARSRHTAAKKTVVDGIKFASRAEARYYQHLKLLEAAGEISELDLQPRFKFALNNIYITRYTADFAFNERGNPKRVVVEIKGRVFRDYPMRKKLFLAFYPEYDFREIKSSEV